jgi:hypothetical protein
MEFHELPAERQAQPRPLGLLVRRPHLAELFEDGSLILGSNPNPRIGHRDLGHAVHHPRAHVNPAPLGRELQGVGQEVQEDLFDLPLRIFARSRTTQGRQMLARLLRPRGCLEDRRHERVRIQRNGRDNVLEFLGLEGTRVGTAWLLRSCGEWCKRLRARTTASPITRMGTSIQDGWRESSRQTREE